MDTELTKLCRCCKQGLPHSAFSARRSNKDGLYSYCKPCSVQKVREAQARRPDWKDYKREYDKARCDTMRDKIAERSRARYNQNRDQALAYAREWKIRNPELRRIISMNYKHRRRAAEIGGVTGKELAEWKANKPKICYWCGSKCKKSHHVDHYTPLSKGGKHEIGNLVIACRTCNLKKSAKDPLDFAREVGRLL